MAMGIASLHPSYGATRTDRIIFVHDVDEFPPLTLPPRPTANKGQKCPGRTAVHKGRVVFGAMDEVVFGRPASEAIVEQLNRLGTKRAFLMVSGTLNRETDEIENIRRVLGAALRRHLRRDAAAHAARGGHCRRRPGPRRRAPISSSPSAAVRSPTAPRRCSFASPTISAIPTTSTASGPVAALRRSSPRRRCARSACRRRLPAASSPPRPASPTRRPRSRKRCAIRC